MDKQTRFAELQAKARETAAVTYAYRIELASRYQAAQYAPALKRKKLDQLERADKRAFDRFFAFLQKISPRSWDSGIPCHWVRDSLTFADATTRGELAIVPPPAWGFDTRDSARFAQALR